MREDKSTGRKILVRYLAVTAFCLLVSVIYGRFSHGIRSFWMSWLALWPLVLGVVPAALTAGEIFPFRDTIPDESGAGEVMKDIYRFGIAAVTVSSFLKGVLEIAGTDSFYPDVLRYAGAVMLVCGAAGFFYVRHRDRDRQRTDTDT